MCTGSSLVRPLIVKQMSSEQVEVKGGHLPAVKAGGMRITQHKPPQEKQEPPKEKPEDEEEEEEVKPASPPKPHLMISGVLARGDADFPTQAVQAIHTKPQPSHEYRAAPSKPNVIHQPRK